MKKAAEIIAVHQKYGRIGRGDAFYKAAYLIVSLMARGYGSDQAARSISRAFDPEAMVNAFLRGRGRP